MITPEIAEELMDKTIQTLGPNGEHWIKGTATNFYGGFCALGAISDARYNVSLIHLENSYISRELLAYTRTSILPIARRTAIEMFPGRYSLEDEDETHIVAQVNDNPDTVFEDIRALLEKTKAHLLEEASL